MAFDTHSEIPLSAGKSYWGLNKQSTYAFESLTPTKRMDQAHRWAKWGLEIERELMFSAVGKFRNMHTPAVDMPNAHCYFGCYRDVFFPLGCFDTVDVRKLRISGLQDADEMDRCKENWSGLLLDEVLMADDQKLSEKLARWEVELNLESDPWEA
jgi:hypothetical protein